MSDRHVRRHLSENEIKRNIEMLKAGFMTAPVWGVQKRCRKNVEPISNELKCIASACWSQTRSTTQAQNREVVFQTPQTLPVQQTNRMLPVCVYVQLNLGCMRLD